MRGIYLLLFALLSFETFAQTDAKPNVIIIYADDLGIGDLSVYGATEIKTPNIDALADEGLRFTNAHSAAATCTPSRYSMMTGKYPFRLSNNHILPGDAKLIISTEEITLPKIFKTAGYATAIVGKWHLGLGDQVEKNWNQDIAPGPNEVGFDYSFIFPATADRVPTIFIENHRVINADANDPITVSYDHKIGEEPTGAENPELLKLKASPNHGHDNTIVNGIGRIGWMAGGQQARWVDEELSYNFLEKAKSVIERNQNRPFFLYFNAIEPHVPRMPATIFKGESGLGLRGDAILQLDHTVGELVRFLKNQGLYDNTLIIFSSDNGPVLDDGYQDEAVTKLNGHDPFGGRRGGKYSAFEAGVRMPFIVHWPNQIPQPEVSDALVGQVDLLASFSQLLNVELPPNSKFDSQPMLAALLGKDSNGREYLVTSSQTFAIQKGDYKYILPNNGSAKNQLVNIELGNDPDDQLYNLKEDPKEQHNIAKEFPEITQTLKALLLSELKQ